MQCDVEGPVHVITFDYYYTLYNKYAAMCYYSLVA